jgi:uncharacterized membrane protein
MKTGRLEAFSDGVLAIIITIMVLELKVPGHKPHFSELRPLFPVFLSYALSFVYVGIYWNNHHHMLHTARRVTAGIMWANLHLLFWLSLIPFVTGWMGENHFATEPVALYGFVLLMAGVSYFILQNRIIADQGRFSILAAAVGSDLKGKLAMIFYALAIPAAFLSQWISGAIYILVAMMWLIPDPRIAGVLAKSHKSE